MLQDKKRKLQEEVKAPKQKPAEQQEQQDVSLPARQGSTLTRQASKPSSGSC